MSINNSPTNSPASGREQPARTFAAYLSASSLWLAGATLSGFVGSWLLIDRIGASPEQTGWASTISRIVPLALLLVGGVLVDRINNRSYLLRMHVVVTLPGLFLAALITADQLSYATVVIFMASMSAVQALSDPARQAVLSRVAPTDIQRSVTLVALASSIVAFLAVSLGGSMDQIGDTPIVVIMIALFAASIWPVARLPSLPRHANHSDESIRATLSERETHAQPPWRDVLEGANQVWLNSLLRPVIGFNFASSMFNAGAYTVAIPFIAREVYAGDSQTFATALGAVTIGAGLSSVLLLVCMPFARPGRIFLLFQLTRALILVGLWSDFGEWAFYGFMALWGINMGVTSSLARSIVQSESPDTQRGRIFSLMLLSFMLASAIGAPLLGALVGAADPLTALLPGVAVSLAIFAAGARSALWHHVDTSSKSLSSARV